MRTQDRRAGDKPGQRPRREPTCRWLDLAVLASSFKARKHILQLQSPCLWRFVVEVLTNTLIPSANPKAVIFLLSDFCSEFAIIYREKKCLD